jgi:hypothetical protein
MDIWEAPIALEVWNSIDVIGPQAEIDRFKALCIRWIVEDEHYEYDKPILTIDFDRIIPMPSHGDVGQWERWGTSCEPFNVREHGKFELGFYTILFDTGRNVPTPVYERLAELFPRLAFDCDSIGSQDEFMAYGWFNGPPGGEHFGYYEVPADYWDIGCKRSPAAQAKHDARVLEVRRLARGASLN